MNDLNCPYCDYGLEVCHDGGENYSEDERHQMKCCNCGENFVFFTSVLFHYEPEKADCLNGEECNFELTHTFPKPFSRMRCTMCGDERELTIKEHKELGIETIDEYRERVGSED